jgi:adenosylmethionine-8-amino-7-oxononanoate aminotransferase
VLSPPLVIEREEVDELLDVLRTQLQATRAAVAA